MTDYFRNLVYENGVQKLLLTDAGYIMLLESHASSINLSPDCRCFCTANIYLMKLFVLLEV